MQVWITIVSGAHWRHFADVRLTLKSADRVGQYVIFNIAQNKGRLVSLINYQAQRFIVVQILRHADYNRRDFTK